VIVTTWWILFWHTLTCFHLGNNEVGDLQPKTNKYRVWIDQVLSSLHFDFDTMLESSMEDDEPTIGNVEND
jgi:hypothetical protein